MFVYLLCALVTNYEKDAAMTGIYSTETKCLQAKSHFIKEFKSNKDWELRGIDCTKQKVR